MHYTFTRTGWTAPVDPVERHPPSRVALAAAAAATSTAAALRAEPVGAILVPRDLRPWFAASNGQCTAEFIQSIKGLRSRFNGSRLLLAAATPTPIKRAHMTAEAYFGHMRERVQQLQRAGVRLEKGEFVAEFEIPVDLVDLATAPYNIWLTRKIDGVIDIVCPSVHRQSGYFEVFASSPKAALRARSMLEFAIEEVKVPASISDRVIQQIVEDSGVAEIHVPDSYDVRSRFNRFVLTGSRSALKEAKVLLEERIAEDRWMRR